MSPPIPRIGLHTNGNGNGDEDAPPTDEDVRRLAAKAVNEASQVFQMVGSLAAETSRACKAAERAEATTQKCLESVERVEHMLLNAANAQTVMAVHRARLESLSTIDDDDPTNVRILKEEVHRLRGAVGKIEDAETAALRARTEKAEALLAKANDKQADRAEWWTRHKLTILVGIPAAVATTILGAYLLASLHLTK